MFSNLVTLLEKKTNYWIVKINIMTTTKNNILLQWISIDFDMKQDSEVTGQICDWKYSFKENEDPAITNRISVGVLKW